MSDGVLDENDKLLADELPIDPEADATVVSEPATPKPKAIPMHGGLVALSVSDLFRKIVEEARQKVPVMGLSTGHFKFDHWLCGFRRQNVTILGARTSFGKTSKALQIADIAIRKQENVLYISAEDNESLSGKRFMARRAGVNAMLLRANRCTPDEILAMERAAAAAEHVPFFVNAIGAPVESMAAFIREHCKTHNTALVIVDYLQCISCNRRAQDRRVEVTYIAKTLSDAVKNSNAAGLFLSQLKRPESGSNKPPTMFDIKESGDVENSAEHVLLGHVGDDGARRLKIEKNKDGPVFEEWVPLPFDLLTASFREVSGSIEDAYSDNRYDPTNDADFDAALASV